MSEAIPKNLQLKLALLYQKYGYNEFSFSDAREVLGVSTSYLGRIMGDLYNSGWVAKGRNQEDNRHKKYKIKPLSDTFDKLK